jgi:integrase
VLRYAVNRRLVRHNEAANLRDEIPAALSKNNPYLTADEIPDFMRVLCSGQYMGAVVRLAILLVMHTLVRTSEARFAKWSEFDLESRLWSIPAERMKMKVAHVVPLSNQVIKILQELKLYTGKYDYLFVTRGFNQPMSENAMIYALYRLGYQGRLTVHGLRATGSTILNEVGFRSDVVEVALAHKDKNQIRVRYNHAQYLEERRKMLQWYSDYLSSLKEGKLIVPVKSSKRRLRIEAP